MKNDEARLADVYREHWHLIAMLLLATLMAGFVLGWILRPVLDNHIIILEPTSIGTAPKPT